MVGHQNYDCFVWEAARATTAAPLFFEPITLAASQATFADGGIRANNPIMEVSREARRLWPNRSIGCLVSLGTGITSTPPLNVTKSRFHEVVKTLVHIATDADEEAQKYRDTAEGTHLIRNKKYFRYSVSQGIDHVDLNEFEKFPYMGQMTLPYLKSVDDLVEDCARNLANPSSTR
jgi:patatin-like phospholipase/acyl hydrolase